MTFPFPFFIKQRTFATFDPSNKGTGVTLSGSNLVATFANAASNSVRATQSIGSKKVYYELTFTTSATNLPAVGFENASGTLNGTIYSDTNGLAAYGGDGHIYSNTGNDQGAYIGSAFGVCRIDVAIIGSSNHYFMRKDNGAWAASGDPVADTNPGTSTGFPTGVIFPAVQGNGIICTANFGASAFAGAVPSGFQYGIYT